MWKLITIFSLTLSVLAVFSSFRNAGTALTGDQGYDITARQIRKQRDNEIQLLREQLAALKTQLHRYQAAATQKPANTDLSQAGDRLTEPARIQAGTSFPKQQDSYLISQEKFNTGAINPSLSTQMETVLKQDILARGLDDRILQQLECRDSSCRAEFAVNEQESRIADPLIIISAMPNLPSPANIRMAGNADGTKKMVVYFTQQ